MLAQKRASILSTAAWCVFARIPCMHRLSASIIRRSLRLSSPVSPSSHFTRAFMSSSLSPLELAKQKAAHQAVDNHVKSGMRVGIGSGSTVVYAVERLGQRKKDEKDFEITCVPSSFQATQLITNAGLTLSDLSRTPELDVAIDGADEVDASLNCIKGGGGCMLQEKLVVSCAHRFIVVADQRKDSTVLGTQWKQGIPIEVVPSAWVPVSNALKKMGGKPTLRMAVKKAGPVLTDNANFIIDVDFGTVAPEKVGPLDAQLQAIVGVVETGLFVGRAEKAYFGQEDGSVKTRNK